MNESLQERPLYLLFKDADQAERLTQALRRQGFKTRNFVNVEVLDNAARSSRPAALLIDIDALPAPGAASTRPAQGAPLIVISNADSLAARLKAVRAGSCAFFAWPLNWIALLHQLDRLQSAEPARPYRAVLLEDGKPEMASAGEALAAAGLSIEVVSSPDAALSALEATEVDLLLAGDGDGQPGNDPLDLIQALRQNPLHQGMSVLLLTTGDTRALSARATAAGVDAVVGLPVAADDLVAITRSRIRRDRDLRAAYGYLASRDAGTGLFNRSYFIECVQQALAGLNAGSMTTALVYLVVPQLAPKPDAPLQPHPLALHVADQLRQQLPPLAVAARLDAGEFAALVPSADAAELETLVHALTQQMGQIDLQLADQHFSGACHLGMTLLDRHHRTASDALQRARQAVRIQSGAAAPASPATDEALAADARWEERLRSALARDRFRLVYQPISSLSGAPSAFYEVFVRMLDDSGNDIPPLEFVSVAERRGLGALLDRWVIGRALQVLEQQRATQHKPVLFVKLFADTVCDPQFAAWLGDRLRQARLEPGRLVLQVAHRTAAVRLAETHDLLTALRALGCRTALEHYADSGDTHDLLTALPLDFVKLSRLLTQDLSENRQHQQQVQAIAGHCRSHKIHSVAALVQDSLNLSVLWSCGVEYIQGYFMQEPADVFNAEERLS